MNEKKFCVVRVAKIKSRTELMESLRHAYREKDTPNADLNLRKANVMYKLNAPDVKGTMKMYEERLPKNVRKNAVHCLEFLVTGSPEQMAKLSKKEQMEFFNKSAGMLAQKYGGGVDNVIHAQVHYDETTPHLTLFVMPLADGKLNAKKFINGKTTLRQMQTDLAQIGKNYGFERGLAKSKPEKSVDIKDGYAVFKALSDVVKGENPQFNEKTLDDMALMMKEPRDVGKYKELLRDLKYYQEEFGNNYLEIIRNSADYGRQQKYFEWLSYLSDCQFNTEIQTARDEYLEGLKTGLFGGVSPETALTHFLSVLEPKLRFSAENHRASKKDALERERERLEQDKREHSKNVLETEQKLAEREKKLRESLVLEDISKENERLQRMVASFKAENARLERENEQLKSKVTHLDFENIKLQSQLAGNQETITKQAEEIKELKANIVDPNWLMNRFEQIQARKREEQRQEQSRTVAPSFKP